MATVNNGADAVLAEILKTALDVAQKTGTFLSNQLPDVIQQLVKWKVFEAITYITILTLLSVASITLMIAMNRKKWFSVDSRVPLTILSFIFVAFLCIPLLTYVLTLIKITVAPKVWLLEYAASLVR